MTELNDFVNQINQIDFSNLFSFTDNQYFLIRDKILLTSAFTMFIALIVNMFVPMPKMLRVNGLIPIFKALGKRVNRRDNSELQTKASGLILLVLILSFFLFLVALFLILAGYNVIVNIIVLTLIVSLYDIQKDCATFYTLIKREDTKDAKEFLSKITLRDCQKLSKMGLCKAMVENVSTRSFQYCFAPLVWFYLLSIPGAVLSILIVILVKSFNRKEKQYAIFGLATSFTYQIVMFIPAVILSIISTIFSFHPIHILKQSSNAFIHFRASTTGLVLGTVASAINTSIGGPRIYSSKMIRFYKIENKEPNELSPLKAMRQVRFCSVIFVCISLTLGILFN